MGRTILTDVVVRRMHPPPTGRLEVWDAALPGFGVRITENGRRSWVLMSRLRSRPIRVTLGAWPAVGLADARSLARDAIQQIARGDDPRAAKRPVVPPAVDDTLAFEKIAAEFVTKWAKPRNRTWPEIERILQRYVLPRWSGRRLDEIRRSDAVVLMDEIAASAPIMANRTLTVIKKLFAWSLDRGLIDVHPVARLVPPSPERIRDRVLTDTELRKLWAAWTAMSYPWGSAFKLLLLTAARRGELEAMTWNEVDVDARLWTAPAERVKTKLPLLVPLSPLAVDVLSDLPRFETCPYVFTTRGVTPIRDWSGAVTMATKVSGVTGWRAHDLRRTVRTNLSRLGVPADIGERVLGHVIPGVRAVYDRHSYMDEKRDALEKWAVHLTALMAGDD